MSIKKISLSVVAVLAFASVGWAHGYKHVSSHTVIDFQKGQDQLTQSAKDSLKDLVTTARAKGQIATIEVAVWSDEPFPARDESLTQADRDLAANRADQIEAYLKNSLNVPSVKTFNMAESSNWLARALKTDGAELKSVFSKEEAPVMSRADFDIIRNTGAPSKAALVVKRKMAADEKPQIDQEQN